MEVLVSGKSDTPYMIPGRLLYYCSGESKKDCIKCPLSSDSQIEYNVNPKKPELLELIDCSKQQQDLKKRCLISGVCPECEVDAPEDDYINIEEVKVVPKIDIMITDSTYTERTIYYIGNDIKTNQTYIMEGYVFPEPKKQFATIIIDKATATSDSIEQFVMTQEKLEALRMFRPKEGQTILEKFKEKHDDLARNVHHVWGRIDMAIAFDIVMHSLLFITHGDEVINGWIRAFILGDTATGKTEMIMKMREHYGVGERIGGQGLTIPGLIGAVVQSSSGRWMLRWGLLALNDRRAVIIEEVTDMPSEIFEKLTDIMSSGIISITKANGHEQTNARTRLLFVSNTKRGAKLESYSDGPSAIREIIPKDEDIRRMDFILTVAKDEVNSDLINRALDEIPEIKHVYVSALCRDLLMWGWSRTQYKTIFTAEATKQVFELTKKMIVKYNDKFPLVESGDQRNKIRKIAAAVAVLCFSCDETGEYVIIQKEHVDFAHYFLDYMYTKPSMSYDIFSEDAHRRFTLSDKRRVALINAFKELPKWESLATILYESQIFKKIDIGDRGGYEKEELRIIFKWLSDNWLIKSIGNHGYRREHILTTIIKEMMEELEVTHDADVVYMPEQMHKKHDTHHEEHAEYSAPVTTENNKNEKSKETRVGTEISGLF